MCNIVLPVQRKVSRQDAREMLRKSNQETQKLNESLREGTWKPGNKVDIVYSKSSRKLE